MKEHSDKLLDLYKERRESGIPVSLTVSFSNGTESFYYSSNPPKPGAADRQKQRQCQRGCQGQGGGRWRSQDSCSLAFLRCCRENTSVAASDTPHEARQKNFHTLYTRQLQLKGLMHLPQNADAANDTDKEVATSANADAVGVRCCHLLQVQ